MRMPREAENRRLVALACRVMAVAGLFDMHGHISLRDGDVAYINGRRTSRIAVGPDEVAIVRVADGSVVAGEPPPGTPPPPRWPRRPPANPRATPLPPPPPPAV